MMAPEYPYDRQGISQQLRDLAFSLFFAEFLVGDCLADEFGDRGLVVAAALDVDDEVVDDIIPRRLQNISNPLYLKYHQDTIL